jgi:hypothetical protein
LCDLRDFNSEVGLASGGADAPKKIKTGWTEVVTEDLQAPSIGNNVDGQRRK